MMPSIEKPILSKDDLQPGDLLLCYSADLKGTDDELRSGYSHVAIKGGEAGIFEAQSTGVKNTEVDTLLEEYGHIAVLRAPDTWSNSHIKRLDEFLKSQCGKPFNKVGMYKVPKRKKAHQQEAMEKVEGYFEGTEAPPADERKQYFCSELITAAFINAEIIGESASILLTPEIFSPEGLAEDKCFGFFEGYIVPYDEYAVPPDDHFQTSI